MARKYRHWFMLLACILSVSPAGSQSLTAADLLNSLAWNGPHPAWRVEPNDTITTLAWHGASFSSSTMDPRCHPHEGQAMAAREGNGTSAYVTAGIPLLSTTPAINTVYGTPLPGATSPPVFRTMEALEWASQEEALWP